jgi:hypothetical protein
MLPSKEAASYLWFGSGIPREMGFWRGISERKFNSQTKEAVSKPENPILVQIQPHFLVFCCDGFYFDDGIFR